MKAAAALRQLAGQIFQGKLRSWYDSEGAQIVELAITLPLLAAIFVATYDFGQAFNVKQKLVAATREGARFAANQTTADLTSTNGTPPSIFAIRDVIDSYLIANNVSDCGLNGAIAAPPSGWTWTFTAGGCSGGNLSLTINRGFTFTTTSLGTSGNVTVTVEATQVTMSYPYRWQFNRVAQILVPGTSYAPVTQIPTSAVVQNLN